MYNKLFINSYLYETYISLGEGADGLLWKEFRLTSFVAGDDECFMVSIPLAILVLLELLLLALVIGNIDIMSSLICRTILNGDDDIGLTTLSSITDDDLVFVSPPDEENDLVITNKV